MQAITETFGQRVRRLRLERALTQVELAEKAGVSQASIFRIENEKYAPMPSPSTIRKVARALGLQPLQLTVG